MPQPCLSTLLWRQNFLYDSSRISFHFPGYDSATTSNLIFPGFPLGWNQDNFLWYVCMCPGPKCACIYVDRQQMLVRKGVKNIHMEMFAAIVLETLAPLKIFEQKMYLLKWKLCPRLSQIFSEQSTHLTPPSPQKSWSSPRVLRDNWFCSRPRPVLISNICEDQ